MTPRDKSEIHRLMTKRKKLTLHEKRDRLEQEISSLKRWEMHSEAHDRQIEIDKVLAEIRKRDG